MQADEAQVKAHVFEHEDRSMLIICVSRHLIRITCMSMFQIGLSTCDSKPKDVRQQEHEAAIVQGVTAVQNFHYVTKLTSLVHLSIRQQDRLPS